MRTGRALQRRSPAQVLEDQRRLGPRHVGVGVEVVDHEGPQICGVTGGHMDEEVIRTGQEVDVDHLRLAPDLLNERADLAPGTG